MVPPLPVTRLDVCDPSAPLFMQTGVVVAGGAVTLTLGTMGTITSYLQPVKPKTRASMPPPPASPLSDYDLQVLRRWARIVETDRQAACEKAVPNRRPVVKVIEEPIQDGNDVVAVIEISDADHDQVLGNVTVSDGTNDVKCRTCPPISTGRHQLLFEGADAERGLTWDLTDGYDRITQ